MKTVLAWGRLGVRFFHELVLSVTDVAVTVLWPGRPIRSAIVAVPLDVTSDAGITLFANMVTLTPGTTSLHISEDRSTLFVHVMNATEDSVDSLKTSLEHGVKEVLE